MSTQRDWEKPIRRMELLMRLKSFPVAFKLLENKEGLKDIPFMRRLENKATMCQMITLVRNFDWTVGADVDDFMSPMCPSIIGLTELPDIFTDGTFRSIVWVKTKEDGKKFEDGIPRVPTGKYEAVAMAPLVYNPFDPDIILIYANPAQMMLLINALQFEDYEVMNFYCVGESSCSDAIARCYLTGKPSMTIPCYGERRYGHAQDEDLVMALPADMLDKALLGLESLYRRGIRYPISYAGAEQDLASAFPGSYGELDELDNIRGHDNRLLLGVTGGVASGKSTVANMLKDLGAPIVDFDVISRDVVEPGMTAWKQIVEYFGEQVLLEDKSLNRQKLSDIRNWRALSTRRLGSSSSNRSMTSRPRTLTPSSKLSSRYCLNSTCSTCFISSWLFIFPKINWKNDWPSVTASARKRRRPYWPTSYPSRKK